MTSKRLEILISFRTAEDLTWSLMESTCGFIPKIFLEVPQERKKIDNVSQQEAQP